MIGSEREAEMFQTTITLFREDEYGRVGEAGYTAQRSYTGQVRRKLYKDIIRNSNLIFLNR